MEYRGIGNSGLKVSAISIGTWHLTRELKNLIIRANEMGITTFDTANVYQNGNSEKFLGEAISGLDRSALVIMSKCFFPFGDLPNQSGLSRKSIVAALEGSLKRLKVDYIDLYQAHHFDYLSPIEETIETFQNLIVQGKILHYGFSNWDSSQLRIARKNKYSFMANRDKIGFKEKSGGGGISNQIELNLLQRKNYLGLKKSNIPIFAWSPLAEGILSGKYLSADKFPAESRANNLQSEKLSLIDNLNNSNLQKINNLKEFAKLRDLKPSQVALAYILAKKNVVSCVIGVSNESQLKENVSSLGVHLSQGEIQELETMFPV